MQAVLVIDSLPGGGIEAAAAFHADWLPAAREALAGEADSLAIVLPAAPRAHDDWRIAIARDLARAHAPKRVNLVGAGAGESREALLSYLMDADGITGQYLAGHE